MRHTAWHACTTEPLCRRPHSERHGTRRCGTQRHSPEPPPELLPPQSTPGPGLALAGTVVPSPPPPPPVTVHYYTCDFCGSHVDHPWFHVAHACPSFLIRSQWAFVRLLSMIPKLEGSYLLDGATVVQPTIDASVTVALETDLHVPFPLPPHRWTVFSPSGLVRHRRPSSAAPEGTSDRVQVVLEAMADATPSLTDLLMVLDTLEWPTRPSPSLNPHVSDKTRQLPTSYKFILTPWSSSP